MAKEIPAVSVIVPMYNVERYIGEMLDSVLAQTLTNFELIIVNNGSTDTSAQIVEKYLPNFGGRLKIIHIPVNTGGPSIPRNKGLEMSRGKYIFFMDGDDAVIKTALEEMFNLSEKFQTDVIHCERRYHSRGVGKDFLKNVELKMMSDVKEPTLLSENLVDRINKLIQSLGTPPWLSFVRRDFLIDSEIKFPPIRREDDVWTTKLLFKAKRFLLIPSAYVIHRMRDDALTFPKERPLDKHLRHWLDRTVNGIAILDEFMGKIEGFRQHPELRYAVLNWWLMSDLQRTVSDCANLSPQGVYEIFKNEFKADLGEHEVLISALFAGGVNLIRNLIITQQKLAAVTPPPFWELNSFGDAYNALEHQGFRYRSGRRISTVYQSTCRRLFNFRHCRQQGLLRRDFRAG